MWVRNIEAKFSAGEVRRESLSLPDYGWVGFYKTPWMGTHFQISLSDSFLAARITLVWRSRHPNTQHKGGGMEKLFASIPPQASGFTESSFSIQSPHCQR
jgi:hypothetical protein